MSDHEKFRSLLESLGLSYKELADRLGLKYTSVTNQLAPAKELPKWAKSMLIVSDAYNPFLFYPDLIWEEFRNNSKPVSKDEILTRMNKSKKRWEKRKEKD